MNTQGADELTGEDGARRSALERAYLGVQRERVALTESFVRMGGDCGPAVLGLVIVRWLRLQRAAETAQGSLSS
jgi:hypothetical protein